MKAEDLKVGQNYQTTSGSVFTFFGFDDNGDLILKSFKNCMKIQSGIRYFFKGYAEELKEYII